MRKVLIAVLLLLIVAGLVVAGAILHLRHIRPDYDDTIATNGVRSSVEVWHDSAGVPHVWAKSDADLYFAQGYLHAQERMWQLELFRRVAEGRLSEIFGERMIDTDKFLRTMGMWRAAGLNEKLLQPDQRALLGAYVAGVNEWIDHHDGPLPPEYTILRFKPEHWTLRNSLAVEKVMALDLSLYYDAAATTRDVRRLPPERARYLHPEDPPWGATIVSAPAIPAVPKPAAMLIEALSITHASNGWVIGGARTKSGKPILANDMHLSLRQPGVWYLMALHAPDMDVVGMTLPGVPFVIAGHNRAVAWGFTNVMMDDVDFFVERVDSSDATRYQTPTGWQTFETDVERLRVKGRDQPVVFTIRRTRHGPVISDFERRLKGSEVLAMQWEAADSSHSLRAIPAFNRAHNAQEFLAAVPMFDSPHQNIVYADTAGHFGYQMAGRIPIRGNRLRPPVLPQPGWTGEWDWHGYVPYSEKPSAPDPQTGFVATANNRQVRGPIGDLISNDWDLPFRAMRITQMILATEKHDAADVHQMQLDVHDLLALRYKGVAARAAQEANKPDIARQLMAWDFRAERNSQEAAYFYIWYETLGRKVSANLFGDSIGRLSHAALNEVLDSGSLGWLGRAGRATLDSLSRAAIVAADSVARGKTWGELHEVVIEHALGAVPALQKLFDFNVGPAPHRGATTTVNVAQYIANGLPIRTSFGPSERHVVDMADVDGVGGFILPSGESGLPGSEHYADMFERWRNGGLWRIPLDRKAAEARTVHRMLIKPGK